MCVCVCDYGRILMTTIMSMRWEIQAKKKKKINNHNRKKKLKILSVSALDMCRRSGVCRLPPKKKIFF